jgi:hypothetical protein
LIDTAGQSCSLEIPINVKHFLLRAEQQAEEAVIDEEPGPIEQATAAAAEELQRLALDGAAKVTNVKVTTDEREVIRRALFSDKMRGLLFTFYIHF